MILKALELAMDRAETEDSEAEVTAETWQPFSVRRADALAEMAESYLAHGPQASSTADRYQVMLHVSAETLQGEITAETSNPFDEDISHLEDGPHVSAETSRRICCDSGISPVVNLVLLCRHHHRLVHEGGFVCEKSTTGQLLFRDERGAVIGISGTVPAITDNPKTTNRIRKRLEELHIHARTCVPDLSGGINMDYPLAVELLWYRDFPIEPD